MKKKLIRTLAASTMTAALGLALMGAPAQAVTKAVDVTKYTLNDVVYSPTKSGCQYTPVTSSVTKSSKIKSYYISAPVTGPGNDPVGISFSESKNRAELQTCPQHGTGKFTIGASRVSASGKHYSDSWNGTDTTIKSFYVRGQSYVTLEAGRSGKSVAFAATARYYSPTKRTTVAYNPKGAVIQVKNGSKWVTLKKVPFSKGKALIPATLGSSKAAEFRLTFPKSNDATAATSKIVKK